MLAQISIPDDRDMDNNEMVQQQENINNFAWSQAQASSYGQPSSVEYQQEEDDEDDDEEMSMGQQPTPNTEREMSHNDDDDSSRRYAAQQQQQI